nr:efflux transporter outer membrane subunit [Bradyrhizobium nitroreducens]
MVPGVPYVHTSAMLIIFSMILAGCAVGPDYQTPLLAMPSHWSQTDATKSSRPPDLSRWWMRLRDPVLNDLIEEAVAGNLDVATAKARVREARASYGQAVGALFPTVTNRDMVTRTNGSALAPSNGSPPAIGTSAQPGSGATYTLFQAGFDASWELDLFGANRRAVEAAAYGIDISEQSLDAALLTLIGDVASDYARARGYQARIALARRSAASQEETTQITRDRFAAGTASAVDLANAIGQAATTRSAIPTLQASYVQTVHRLSVLTGRPPAALQERLEKPAPVPRPRLPIPTGIPADVLLTRPDVRLAERRYAQYTARIGQAEAARYPSASLTGNIATAGTQLGDLGKSSSISWSFGPTVTVPIFNAGKLRAAVEIAEAQRDQHFVTYRLSILTALKDVEDALVALGQERLRARALSTSVEAYREAASLSQSLYKAGSSSFLDVLTAQRSLYNAEDALIENQILTAIDYIALNKALGGGWDGSVDTSRPETVDAMTGPRPVRPN